MKTEPKILARPGSLGEQPRRGELQRHERERCAWFLDDYAEMLESCALGLGEETDRDTMTRVDEARSFAIRLRAI